MKSHRSAPRVLVLLVALLASLATTSTTTASAASDAGVLTASALRLPTAPTAVTAAAGDGSASVSWTASNGNGAPISRYLVRSEPDGIEIGVSGTQTSTVLHGLRNGTTYTFTVRADQLECMRVSACPTSAPSNPVTPVWLDAPVARTIDLGCPAGEVPPSSFADVPAGSAHARAVSCLLWWGVTSGRTPTTYAPAEGVTREAMAAFVARALLAVDPEALPESPPNAFSDDDESLHQRAIDQLAAVGIVGGTGAGGYSPKAPVTRGQMARFLAKANEHLLGEPLPTFGTPFSDLGDSPFWEDVGRVLTVGLASGYPDGTFRPRDTVNRAQMASFLARTLDLFVELGADLPNAPAAEPGVG